MSDTRPKPKFEITYVSDAEGSEGLQSTGEGRLRAFTRRRDGTEEFSSWYKGQHKPDVGWAVIDTMNDHARDTLLAMSRAFYLMSRKAQRRLDGDYDSAKTQVARTAAMEVFCIWRDEKILALRQVVGPDELSLEQSSRFCNGMVEFARAQIKTESIPTELEIAEAGRQAVGQP